MKRWQKVALITVGIVLLLAGFIAFALPGIVRSQAVKRVEESTGRTLSIGKVSINPFSWTMEVRDLRLTERGGGDTFLAFSSARVAVSPSSLFRLAPIVSEARLASPYLRIVRTGANSYNFSDLLEGNKEKKGKEEGQPRFSLNNVAITNGSVDFIDRGLRVEKRHAVRKIEIAIPFVTTMPYLADRYITPRFSAVVNGSPLHVEGKLRPFPKAVEASVTIDLKELSLPYYLAYVPGGLPVRVESGRMSTRMAVSYRAAQKEQPELALSGGVTLAGLKVADRTGAKLLALTRLEAGIARARLLMGELDLSSLSADGLEVFLSRDKKGVWSHSRLVGTTRSASAPRKKMLVSVAETKVRNGRLHVTDSLPPGGFTTGLEGIALDMRGYSTAPGKRANYSISFATLRGEKGRLKGTFSPEPLATSSSFEFTGIALEGYYPYLAQVLRTPVKGRLDVAAAVEYGGPDGLKLENVAVRARQLSAPFGAGEGATLATLSLAGGRFSQKENLLDFADVTLNGGNVRFSRDGSGRLSPLALLREGGKGKSSGKVKKESGPPLRYRIGRVSGAGLNVAFTDGMLEERPTFALKNIAFTLDKLTGPTGLALEKFAVQARQLSVPFGKGEGLTLASLSLSGGRFSQKKNLLEVGGVTLKDGDLRFSRDRNGTLSPLTLLRAGGSTAANGTKAATPPLRYRIGRVSGAGLSIAFTDGMLVERPSYALKNIAFTLEKLTGPTFGPIPFKLAAAYGPEGSLRAAGSVTPTPLKLKGELAIQRIPLTDFAPYLPDNLNIILVDGYLDTQLSLSLASSGKELAGNFEGSAGVRSFYCLDANTEDLLKWDSLELDKVTGSLSPFTLAINDVSLSKFYSRLVIEKDGTLNLLHLYTPKPAAPAGQSKTVPSPVAPAAAGKQKAISIATVTMQDGTIDYTDRHLKSDYSTTLYNLGGRISGLSSQENRFADVDLRGNLQNQSPLRITGRINPLRDNFFADLKVSFTDIELSPMTPYSGTFLGYAVDKGKLFLDLQYKIENKQLNSENKVVIDQLTFGKRIESDKATNLPVRLAVALLKDRKGEIRLDLPVTGRTDDPQFSVWRVVLRILKNLLVKAATAPFSLFQSLFGGKEDFNSVAFAFGSSELSSGEREKLLKLATALRDRPSLKVEVAGFVDKERDAEGYRNELLLKKMRAEKFLDLVKEKKTRPVDSPETMEFSPEEYSHYLKVVYKKEKFPKPRNILGFVKDIPDSEMKKLILANTVVGDKQLHELAHDRAATVSSFLVEHGKMDAARVFQKRGDIYRAPAKEGEPGSRVEFGAAVE